MKSIALLTLFLATLVSGCKKEPPKPQLPPYTQEGKNIFACKISGEVFIAEGVMDNNPMSPKGVDYYWILSGSDTLIYINANEEKPLKASISLKFIFESLNFAKELNQYEKSVGYFYIPVENYVLAESKYSTNEDHKGWVTVKYFQNNILAGTFEFTAIDDRGEIIHITEGRFDLSTN
ncbi:MAG: hypothetical protein WD077_06675 [Bacteroidia bacterium]